MVWQQRKSSMFWFQMSFFSTPPSWDGDIVVSFKMDDKFLSNIKSDSHSTILSPTQRTLFTVIREFVRFLGCSDISGHNNDYVMWDLDLSYQGNVG